MVVLAQLWLVFYFLLDVAVVSEQPAKESFLNLLVVLLFEKLVAEELHGTHDQQLSALWTDVESSYWAVCRETNWTTRKQSLGGLSNVDRATIWVHKFQTSVLVSTGEVVLGVTVLFGVLSRLVVFVWLVLAVGCLDQFVIEAPVANEGLLWMKVFVEGFSNDAVLVDAHAHLLKHGIDVGVALLLSAFGHHNHAPATVFDVASDVLQLLGIEGEPWTSKEKEMALLEALDGQF